MAAGPQRSEAGTGRGTTATVRQSGRLRLAALEEIAIALAMTRAPGEVAEVVTRVAARALGARIASIRLITTDNLLVRLDEQAGASHEPLVDHAIPLHAVDLVAEAARCGKQVRVESPEEGHRRYPILWRVALVRGIEAAVAAPLQVQGETIGVLSVSFGQAHAFTLREQRFIGAVAGLTAQALDRARYAVMEHERAGAAEALAGVRQQEAHQADVLARLSVDLAGTFEPSRMYERLLSHLGCLLPCDRAAVVLHEEGWAVMTAAWGALLVPPGTRLFRLADADPVLRATLAAGRAALLCDAAALPAWITSRPFSGPGAIRSVLLVPLILDGSLVGVLEVASVEPNIYRQRHADLAVRFAEHAARALLTVRLYQAEQQRALAAEELNRLRDGFVAAISHELRTPLTAILGYAELLEAHWDAIDDGRRRQRISSIVAAANRLQRLVEDVLLLNQLETEVLVPNCHTVLLVPLIRQAIDEVQGSYAGQIVEMSGPDATQVTADPDRTVQILVNLVDNAAKYSPEGHPIRVTWAVSQADVVLYVHDEGPGIGEHGREQLFTRFGRVPGSKVRAGHVGTGLGLYLGRLLARAMGGDVDLASTGPQGSAFLLRLRKV